MCTESSHSNAYGIGPTDSQIRLPSTLTLYRKSGGFALPRLLFLTGFWPHLATIDRLLHGQGASPPPEMRCTLAVVICAALSCINVVTAGRDQCREVASESTDGKWPCFQYCKDRGPNFPGWPADTSACGPQCGPGTSPYGSSQKRIWVLAKNIS